VIKSDQHKSKPPQKVQEAKKKEDEDDINFDEMED